MPKLTMITPGRRSALAFCALLILGSFGAAHAAPVNYTAVLTGAAEAPPNGSAGTGVADVTIDAVAHTMSLNVVFAGLTGLTTSAHIHAATATAGTGTAGVATTTPTFAGFPGSVSSGSYSVTLDMTQASSYNASYVTAQGGTTAAAEAALFQAIADGKAYFNLHSSAFPGGELRGFLMPSAVSTDVVGWGQVKALFR